MPNAPTIPAPPGPRGHFLFGVMREYLRDPLSFMLQTREQYGDVVRMRFIGGFMLYIVSHPDGVEHILQTHQKRYRKGVFQKHLKLLAGEGLVSSEGEFWRKQRRLAQPAFHKPQLAKLAATMVEEAQQLGDRWSQVARSGAPFDLTPDMMELTLRIVARALFSADLANKANDLRHDQEIALRYIDYRMSNPLAPPEKFPTARNRQFSHALSNLDSFVYGLIHQRRKDPQDRGDLLSMLLNVKDEESNDGMDDKQVRDEVMTLMFAGHETSGTLLVWVWYLLAKHPEIETRLHKELAATLNGRTATFDDLPNLPYTRIVIEETLRLYPPAWGVAREAIEDDEVSGYRIPKGSQVAVSQYLAHRHPDFWDDPAAFRPERFAADPSPDRPRYAFFPFGGGPRLCIGNHFAMMELQLTLATLTQRFRVELAPGPPIGVQPLVTLKPDKPVMVKLQPRNA